MKKRSSRYGAQKFGYAVDVASDGEEALQLDQINEYDAIVLDLNIPKIDGIDVLKEIPKLNQEIKVLSNLKISNFKIH